VYKAYAGYRHVPGNHEPFPQTEQRIKDAIMADKKVVRVNTFNFDEIVSQKRSQLGNPKVCCGEFA